MTNIDEIDTLAAEFVMGTLDWHERAAVTARRTRDPELDRAIEAWVEVLAPINALIVPIGPPTSLKSKLMQQIGDAQGRTIGNVVALRQSVGRWRATAVGAGALAASLTGFIIIQTVGRPVASTSYVAVLQKDAQSPAFLMTVDIGTRSFTVRPVAAERQAGKSYELWLVNQKLGAPKSLGIVGDQAHLVSAKLAAFASGDIQDATYAVSVEPEGGSPTGAPTGPVVYAGKLVQTTP